MTFLKPNNLPYSLSSILVQIGGHVNLHGSIYGISRTAITCSFPVISWSIIIHSTNRLLFYTNTLLVLDGESWGSFGFGGDRRGGLFGGGLGDFGLDFPDVGGGLEFDFGVRIALKEVLNIRLLNILTCV